MKKFLDYSFCIIIVIVVIGTVFLIYTTVSRHDIQPYTRVVVQVTEPIVLKDALGRDLILVEQSTSILDSLVCLLNKKSAEIDYKYELLLKARENESFLLEILASIIALIMGVLSFLGFRSIKDIEESVKENAEKIAKETANKSTTDILERIANSKVQEIAKAYYEKTYKGALIEEMKSVVSRDFIDDINDRLSRIETVEIPEQESSNDETFSTEDMSFVITASNMTEEERERMNRLTNQE